MNDESKIWFFIKPICIALILQFVLFFVLAIVVSISNVSENIIVPFTIFISSISLLIGSFLLTRNIKQKGIFFGMIFGGTVMLILYVISSTVNHDFSLNMNSCTTIVLGLLSGAIGGVIGVNK